jgi:hypothetical protein
MAAVGGQWRNTLQLGTFGLLDSAFHQPLDAAAHRTAFTPQLQRR